MSDLRSELSAAEQRLAHIHGAVENIQSLLNESAPGEREPQADNANEDESIPRVDPAWGQQQAPNAPLVRQRVPSTDWVAEIVNNFGRVATRDEIFEAFQVQRGFPPSWTNPRNSIGNALNRAAERHMIQRIDSNNFAPEGYSQSGAEATHPGVS